MPAIGVIPPTGSAPVSEFDRLRLGSNNGPTSAGTAPSNGEQPNTTNGGMHENGETSNGGGAWPEPQPIEYAKYLGARGEESGRVWDAAAQIYEWDGAEGEGEIGPEHPELECKLFGNPDTRGITQGIDFEKYGPLFPSQEYI